MRLVFDLSVLRQPAAGTTRYASELFRAMDTARGDDVIAPTGGWPRLPRGGSYRRLINLASDLGWQTIGALAVSSRRRGSAWFGPANILPLALRRPCVVTIHDVNFILAREQYDRGYATYATMMFRLSGQRAAAILTHSVYSRDRLVAALGLPADRVVVAYPGLDHAELDRAQDGPVDHAWSAGAPYVLFVGQTEPHKNLIRLIDAWPQVPTDLDLVLAGPPGRDEERVIDSIARSPVRKRIHRLGWIDEARLRDLYAGAACFVFPSLAEGFGLPPLEAMARGIPTAVADAGALPEVTDGAALYFDPDDSDAIADAVRRIIEDGALRARLAEAGRIVSERYRWGRTAEIAWAAVRAAERAC